MRASNSPIIILLQRLILVSGYLFSMQMVHAQSSSFEATLRAYQERWLSFPIQWPNAGDGTQADPYPPDGFYSDHAGGGNVQDDFDHAVYQMSSNLASLASMYLEDDMAPGSLDGHWLNETQGASFFANLYGLPTLDAYAQIVRLLGKMKYILSSPSIEQATLMAYAVGATPEAAFNASSEALSATAYPAWSTGIGFTQTEDEFNNITYHAQQWGFNLNLFMEGNPGPAKVYLYIVGNCDVTGLGLVGSAQGSWSSPIVIGAGGKMLQFRSKYGMALAGGDLKYIFCVQQLKSKYEPGGSASSGPTPPSTSSSPPPSDVTKAVLPEVETAPSTVSIIPSLSVNHSLVSVRERCRWK